MNHKVGLVHKLVSLALVLVLLALISQACGGKQKEVIITPSPTPTEVFEPTTIPPLTPRPTLEPTPTPTTTPTPAASPNATPTPAEVPTVSVEEVKSKLDSGQNIVLVDVRDQATFDTSHIGTAISIPLEELPSRCMEIPQGLEVIIYAECA
jgi:hypothetical protein